NDYSRDGRTRTGGNRGLNGTTKRTLEPRLNNCPRNIGSHSLVSVANLKLTPRLDEPCGAPPAAIHALPGGTSWRSRSSLSIVASYGLRTTAKSYARPNASIASL